MTTRANLFFLALLTGPFASVANELYALTPSGLPETMFAGEAPDVVSRISSRCMDVQWTVASSTNNEVVCESPLSTGQSIMGQMLLGNSYSTPPRRFFRFNVSEIEGVSRVQASGWMETQMAFGQVKRVAFSGPEFHNNVMGFMSGAGGKFPVGTTFPNHAVMGVVGQGAQNGKYGAYRVAEVTPNSAAARAGIQAGDLITQVAGRKFKNDADYLENLAKATKSPTYQVEVLREGKSIALTLEREYRPTFSETVVAKGAAPTTTAPAATASVADELAKLLKLKEQGVLTQTEFDSQKQKLLAQ